MYKIEKYLKKKGVKQRKITFFFFAKERTGPLLLRYPNSLGNPIRVSEQFLILKSDQKQKSLRLNGIYAI